MDIKVNYAGITRRVIAGVIDRIIMVPTFLILYFILLLILVIIFKNNELGGSESPIEEAFFFVKSNGWLVAFLICSFYFTLEILIIARFACTLGQFLCGIYIKDINTLKNITITQAIIRTVSREFIFHIRLFLTGFIIWSDILTCTVLALMLTLLLCAIFDKRKQFFHDKIAGTMAIDYRALS